MRKKIIGIVVCILVITTGFSFDVLAKQNNPPNKPSTPNGPTEGEGGVSYVYESMTIDSDGDQIYYLFDWGDGSDSGWVGTYDSGDLCQMSHIWAKNGSYSIKVKAKDTSSAESPWSDALAVTIIGDAPPHHSGRKISIYIGLIKDKEWDLIKMLFFTCIIVLHIRFIGGHIELIEILSNQYYARVDCTMHRRIGIITNHIICAIFFEKTMS